MCGVAALLLPAASTAHRTPFSIRLDPKLRPVQRVRFRQMAAPLLSSAGGEHMWMSPCAFKATAG